MVISWCFGAGQVLGVLLCMCPVRSVCAVFVAGDFCSGRDRENRRARHRFGERGYSVLEGGEEARHNDRAT